MKNACLLFIFVFLNVFAIAQYSLYEMVLYYPVEKAISPDTIYDISGYQTHGKLHNVSLTADRNGNENSAISFNGYDSYIEMDCPYFTQPEYCYSLWAKVYSNPPNGESDLLISIGTDHGIDHFLMNTTHYSANNHTGWLGGGYHEDETHTYVRLQTPSIENEWVHITYLRNSEILMLFINGEHAASSIENVQVPYFGDDFVGNIGRRVNGLQYYYGAMDDIRIYERMLDPDEIMEAYIQEGIPQPMVNAGSDHHISSSTSSLQLSGEARLYSNLNWSTTGDGVFSDPSNENPIYYLGDRDRNSMNTELILTCHGYSGNSEIISDTVQLINSSLGIISYYSEIQLSIFPNPISTNNRVFIESSTIKLSNIKEVQLISAYGKKVHVKQPNIVNQNTISVTFDHLQNGIYFLMLDGVRTSEKIVIVN